MKINTKNSKYRIDGTVARKYYPPFECSVIVNQPLQRPRPRLIEEISNDLLFGSLQGSCLPVLSKSDIVASVFIGLSLLLSILGASVIPALL